MQHRYLRLSALIVSMSLVGACASVPRDHGRAEIATMVNQRTGATTITPDAEQDDAQVATLVAAALAQPLTIDSAVRIAFLRNPRLHSEYAELGIARADLLDAGRLSNPTLSYARLNSRGGGHEISASITQSFADLLMLPARKRLAAGEFLHRQQTVAAALIELASAVETAWFTYTAQTQIAAMRGAVRVAAEASAELAQRFFDAGNITALQLTLEQAAMSQARLDALRADAELTHARLALNTLMGLSGPEAAWPSADRLPTPVDTEDGIEALLSIAHERRLDLAAARQRVKVLEDSLSTTRRWRWFGAIDVGIEHDDEGGGDRATGPSLALQLPIFNQGQGALARARAQLDQARAELRRLEIDASNGVRLGVESVAAMRRITEQYRTALIPQREAIVARQQERVNFMLIGVFELILAKQQEYDAYQGYLEAVRDYWLARVELSRAIGERLPSDASIGADTLGVEEILTPPSTGMQGMDMQGMDMQGKDMKGKDPHAGHAMPKKDSETKANPDDEPAPHEHDGESP